MDQSKNNKGSFVIDTCKQAYITRLFNRNPLLHFAAKTTKSSDRFSLTDIFAKNLLAEVEPSKVDAHNPVALAQRAVEDLLNNLDTKIEFPDKALFNKLTKQRTVSKELSHMTGQHTLYVGFPMLYATIDGKAPIFAPLFLIPVNVQVDAKRIVIGRVGLKDDVLPLIANPLLSAWCEKYKDIKIDWRKACDTINKNLDNAEPNTLKSIFDDLKAPTKPFLEMEPVSDDLAANYIASPNERDVRGWGAQKVRTKLVNCSVLGVVKYSGASLLNDLEELTQATDDQLGILKALVTPRSGGADDVAPVLNDAQSWHIVDTDPPQKATIDQSNLSNWIVIQGPPGTGKSQTIVNLIGNALAKKQTVAVFCEKPAALEVVKKRLDGANLGELTLLIKKPDAQRGQVIKGIKSLTADWPDAYRLQGQDYRANQASKIGSIERKIDQNMAGFQDKPEEGIEKYASIKTRLLRIERELGYEPTGLLNQKCHTDLIRVFRSLRLEQARDARWYNNEIKTKLNGWERTADEADFNTSPWREHRTDVAIDVMGLRKSLNQINKLVTIDVSKLSKRSAHWFSGNKMMAGSLARSFFDDDKRDAQEHLTNAIESIEKLGTLLRFHDKKKSLDGVYTRTDLRYIEPIWLESLGSANDVQQLLIEMENTSFGKVLLKYVPDNAEQWGRRLEAAVCSFWLECWEEENPAIYNSVLPLKRNIEELKTLVKEKKELDAKDIRNNYRYRMFSRDSLEEMNLLRERSGRYGPKTQIRDLMDRGWSVTRSLHPVLLTTPEVACEILPLEQGLFDLVIIDEASQMFTAEALPLIFRGKKVVIAGDNKQMPPSNFFNAGGDQDEEYEEEYDEDGNAVGEDGVVEQAPVEVQNNPTMVPALDNSCLLDAAEAVIPKSSPAQRLLKIHYRSSFRELIEFSNHAFYEGELEAPPGNVAAKGVLKTPIEFVEVKNATFYKGVNELEAYAIVEYIKGFWSQDTTPSLGVIVMNAQQKMRIEDLLREYAENDHKFATRLEAERERESNGEDIGFFIRNVENVQGDERDIIVLGATYAGDSRRFGPLATAEHGRRRLNVAVTRARHGMVVFSSMNGGQRAGDETVNDKWFFLAYLRYAKAIAQQNMDEVDLILDKVNPKREVRRSAERFDSEFEREVAEFLAENGYRTESQAPESGFRIDLAVKCNDRLGYLCGIECDGAAYHSSWTARSNDIWRQSILESKGWDIYRIWSTDWFNDQRKAKQAILDHLQKRQQELV